jgi:hypothetical protein
MSGADQFRLLVSRPVQETFFSEIPRDSISRPLKPQSETMFFRQNIFFRWAYIPRRMCSSSMEFDP